MRLIHLERLVIIVLIWAPTLITLWFLSIFVDEISAKWSYEKWKCESLGHLLFGHFHGWFISGRIILILIMGVIPELGFYLILWFRFLPINLIIAPPIAVVWLVVCNWIWHLTLKIVHLIFEPYFTLSIVSARLVWIILNRIMIILITRFFILFLNIIAIFVQFRVVPIKHFHKFFVTGFCRISFHLGVVGCCFSLKWVRHEMIFLVISIIGWNLKVTRSSISRGLNCKVFLSTAKLKF